MKILKVGDLDEVMEFQQRNSLSHKVSVLFILYWGSNIFLDRRESAKWYVDCRHWVDIALTLTSHSSFLWWTSRTYSEERGLGLCLDYINQATLSQSEDILIRNLALNIQPWHLEYSRCTQLVMCTWSIQGCTCVDSSQIW